MQARINVLRDKLSRAVLIDPSQFPKDEVAFGATVRVKDLNFGDEEEFTLVGAGEEDYDTGKILITSPLAQGLVGKKIGDRVEIVVPQGTLKFEILEIRVGADGEDRFAKPVALTTIPTADLRARSMRPAAWGPTKRRSSRRRSQTA